MIPYHFHLLVEQPFKGTWCISNLLSISWSFGNLNTAIWYPHEFHLGWGLELNILFLSRVCFMSWSQAPPHSQYCYHEWYLNMSSTQDWMHDCRSTLTKAKHNSSLSQGMWNLLSTMGIWKRLCERSPYRRQNKQINKTTWNLGFSKVELIKTPLNCSKNNYFKSGSYNFIYHSMRWETMRQTGVLRKLVFLDSLFNSTLRTSPVTKLRFRFNFRLGPSSETGCMALFTFLNFSSSNLWSGANNPYLLRLQWEAEGWVLINPPSPTQSV